MAAATAGHTITGKDGQAYALRPIRDSDAPSLMRGYDALSERGKWFRMLHAVPHLTDKMARDYCNPPADELCLVVEGREPLAGEILGGARVAGLGPGRQAEFSVSFRPEARGLGLARQALETVIAAARAAGCAGVIGTVARPNDAMRGLARRLGMKIAADPDDSTVVLATLDFKRTPLPR